MSKRRVLVRIGDLCTRVTDGTHLSPAFTESGVPFLFISNIIDGQLSFDTKKFITKATHAELTARCPIEVDDVLYSTVGSYGNAAVVDVDRPFAFQRHIAHLKPDLRRVDSRYLRSCLVSSFVRTQVDKRVRGVAQKTLNLSDLRDVEIPLPPLEEQRRIAAILDAADSLRAKRRAALAKLDQLAQSICRGVLRDNKAALAEVSLSSVAADERHSFVNGPFGSDLLTSELQSEGVPVIYIRDIRDGEYRRRGEVYVTTEKAKKIGFCGVRSGDVLIAKVGDPPGVAATYPDGMPDAIVTQDVVRLRPDKRKALPEFLAAYLNSDIGQWRIRQITVQATRARFSLGDFKKRLCSPFVWGLTSVDVHDWFRGEETDHGTP